MLPTGCIWLRGGRRSWKAVAEVLRQLGKAAPAFHFVARHQPLSNRVSSTQGPQQRGRSSSDQAEPSGKEGDSLGDMRSSVKPLKASVTSVFVGPGISQAPKWLSRIAADELEAQAGDVSCLTDCFGLTFLKSCAITSELGTLNPKP